MELSRFAPSSAVLREHPDAWVPLSDPERRRVAQLTRAGDCDDFVAARALARAVAAEATGRSGRDIVLQQCCEACAGPHGRPFLPEQPEWSVSWSHASGWVAAVVADRRCGIDIEPRAGAPDLGPGRDLTWWTRQEALAKAGAGSLDDIPLDDDDHDVTIRQTSQVVVATAIQLGETP